ncbi:MAG TPA: hypothetical protein VGH61_11535 [Steroidobacteraceae bacterium]
MNTKWSSFGAHTAGWASAGGAALSAAPAQTRRESIKAATTACLGNW